MIMWNGHRKCEHEGKYSIAIFYFEFNFLKTLLKKDKQQNKILKIKMKIIKSKKFQSITRIQTFLLCLK